MKANELMIGDWVLDNRCNIPIKINPLIALIMDIPEWSPIPLTAKTLKKNGFDKHYWGNAGENRWNYMLYYGEDKIVFSCDLTGLSIYLEAEHWLHLNSINYIHELQHALRLCGLTELAENFKI